mmetsp:Transcript_22080/g.30732  ORF Transcript_22080/g.30732 Transcript_22080/m.30732 type:complete len:262 (-) Transcript_22080:534-1319(-)
MEKSKKIAIIVLSLLAVMSALGYQRYELKFSDLKVNIDNSEGNFFVDKLDIESQVFAYGYQKGKEPVLNIKKRLLETQFDDIPSLKKAEVYSTLNGMLHVDIIQRTPLVRVFTEKESFYLDQEGFIMPLSVKYTAKVPVANGDIKLMYEDVAGRNFAFENKFNKSNSEARKLHEAYVLCKNLKEVPIWDAQFKQLYFTENGDVELIPAVGNHVILIDGIENLDESLTKLMILYKEGLSKTGWNNYKAINLKYKDQIVGIKR